MSKGKDPAFLFYPADWMGGTMTMSRAHKGAYMDLLMCQFNQGHMTYDDVKTILGTDYETMWEKLKTKFITDDAGLYYNKKLNDEILKRKSFTDSRRKNLEGKHPHMEPHMVPHTDKRMVNVNEDDNVIKDETDNKGTIKGKKGKKEFTPPTIEEFKKYFVENGFTEELATRAYKGYEAADWHDSEGKKISSWKQKAQHVWFNDRNKQQSPKPQEPESPSDKLVRHLS